MNELRVEVVNLTRLAVDPAEVARLVARVIEVLRDVEGVSTVRLAEGDVARHPLVKRIIRAYDQWDEKA